MTALAAKGDTKNEADRANAFDVAFAITLCEFTPNPQHLLAEM